MPATGAAGPFGQWSSSMSGKDPLIWQFALRRVLSALGGTLMLALVVSLLAPSSLAQSPSSRRGGTFDSFFSPYAPPSPPRSIPYERSERPADYTRAPSPRRPDAPTPNQVLVLGDSMADWLAYGLEDALADSPEMGVVRKNRVGSGLIRYEPRNEALDWTAVAREAITTTKPKFIVIMIGLNDRQPIRLRQLPPGATPPAAAPPSAATPTAAPPGTVAAPPSAADAAPAPADAPAAAPSGGPPGETPSILAPEPARGTVQVLEFGSDAWAEQYVKRIDAMIGIMKSANVPVFWVGLPSIRGPKSTGDAQIINDLFRTRAEKAGITYIDVWDGFVDENGHYTMYGPDFEGQTRRLRVGDGVHFTKAGARKLAHYVEREIRRTMTRGVTTVALPAAEPAPQIPVARPGQPTPRPLSGPVLPLTASAAGKQDLLGGGPPSAPVEQVAARRVLQRGEAVAPPAGRSDDFSWPRRDIAPFGTDPVVATTTDPLPVMRAVPAATTVPVPSEEPRTVDATPARRAPAPTRAASQQQQRRGSSIGNLFQFFR